jgi:hypothetical protein
MVELKSKHKSISKTMTENKVAYNYRGKIRLKSPHYQGRVGTNKILNLIDFIFPLSLKTMLSFHLDN